MIRQVEFTGSIEHQVFFRMLYEAFRSRGSAKPDDRVSKDDRRRDGKILKALKAVSVPDPKAEMPKDGDLDARPLVLRRDGGALALEQPEFSRLQKYVDETQFVSVLADVACDLEDFLDTAAKVETEKA